MTKRLSVRAAEIPLFLLPKVIARLIRLKGEAVYRISVVRTHWHHYNVSVRTKRIKRELAALPVAIFSAVAGTTKQKKRSVRRCAA
jgi:hypothetical protein